MTETKHEYRLLVRIGNVDIKGHKKLCYALSDITGVSFSFANAICQVTGIDKFKKIGDCTETDVNKINEVLQNPLKFTIPVWLLNRRKDYETGENKHLLSSDLEYTTGNDIRRMRKIKCRRGVRHSLGLPVRGQCTKSHFRTGASIGVKTAKVKAAKA
jgi:small subunit ribosomal protein S13